MKGVSQEEMLRLFSFLFLVRMRHPVMNNLQSERGALTCFQFNLQYSKSVSHSKSFEEADLIGIHIISLQLTAGQVLWWVDCTAYVLFN